MIFKTSKNLLTDLINGRTNVTIVQPLFKVDLPYIRAGRYLELVHSMSNSYIIQAHYSFYHYGLTCCSNVAS